MKLLVRALIPILMIASAQSLANSKCDSVVKSPFYSALDEVTQEEITEHFIGYIKNLFEAQILNLEDLIYLKNSLDSDSPQNPLSRTDRASIKLAAKPHVAGLDAYLEPALFDSDTVIATISKIQESTDREQRERGVVEQETKNAMALPIRFNRIRKNGFWISAAPEFVELADHLEAKGEPIEAIIAQVQLMEEQRAQHAKESRSSTEYEPFGLSRVQLEQDIEVMSMPVTFMQWVEVMGEVPRRYFAEYVEPFEKITIGDTDLAVNYPINHVTWWSAVAFANRLSELHGYRPYYNLSRIKAKKDWQGKSGRYEAGDFEAENFQYSIDAPGGDPYKGEGYRLPTAFESEYLIRELGKFPHSRDALLSLVEEVDRKTEAFFPGHDHVNLAVDDSDFVILEDGKFFGLKTNIKEFLNDTAAVSGSNFSKYDRYKYKVVKNPFVEPVSQGYFKFGISNSGDRYEYDAGDNAYRVRKGISGFTIRKWENFTGDIVREGNTVLSNESNGRIGFRLVRTLPDSSKSK